MPEENHVVDTLEKEPIRKVPTSPGLATRTQTYRTVYAVTRDHRQAIAAYCHGNKHLIDNARGCGNMD